MNDFHYITTQAEADKCCSILNTKNTIGLDLEFDKNRHAFGFTLSMLQINDGENIYLIDGLTDLNLNSFFDLFENETIQKIVFAFGEDIRLLHSLQCFPKNIYDLDTCAKLLNYDPCSLSTLTHVVLNEEEAPSSQKSNWLKRPLTKVQLDYAAEDVRHLFNLKSELEKSIEDKGITTWLAQENARYNHQDYSEVESFSPIKTKDKRGLTELEFHIFKQLMDLREEIAEDNNLPGYKIVAKEVLLDLANGSLRLDGISGAKGVSGYFKNNKSKSIIQEILRSAYENADRLGLSKTSSAIPRLTKEAFKKKQEKIWQSNKIIESILQPIKDLVVVRYGENTANYIFSNRVMSNIAQGKLKECPPYKQILIWEFAEELGIDLGLLNLA
jgi:ribonuclease D